MLAVKPPLVKARSIFPDRARESRNRLPSRNGPPGVLGDDLWGNEIRRAAFWAGPLRSYSCKYKLKSRDPFLGGGRGRGFSGWLTRRGFPGHESGAIETRGVLPVSNLVPFEISFRERPRSSFERGSARVFLLLCPVSYVHVGGQSIRWPRILISSRPWFKAE